MSTIVLKMLKIILFAIIGFSYWRLINNKKSDFNIKNYTFDIIYNMYLIVIHGQEIPPTLDTQTYIGSMKSN